jgi:hypothetical protein
MKDFELNGKKVPMISHIYSALHLFVKAIRTPATLQGVRYFCISLLCHAFISEDMNT